MIDCKTLLLILCAFLPVSIGLWMIVVMMIWYAAEQKIRHNQ